MAKTKTKKAKAEVQEETQVIRPGDLAAELEVDAKRIRAFLRSEFTRPIEAKNSSWALTAAQAKAVRKHFTPATEEEDSGE